MSDLPFQVFDRDADFDVTWRKLPHWSQPGCVAFVTFRTHDSMPADVVQDWHVDRRN